MHQCPFMRGLLRWHVDYPFKWPVMQKAFPWHEVIMPSMHTATAQEKTSIRRQLRFRNWLYIHRYTELGQATKFALATAKMFPWDTQISEEKIELNWIEVRLLQHDPCRVCSTVKDCLGPLKSVRMQRSSEDISGIHFGTTANYIPWKMHTVLLRSRWRHQMGTFSA